MTYNLHGACFVLSDLIGFGLTVLSLGTQGHIGYLFLDNFLYYYCSSIFLFF